MAEWTKRVAGAVGLATVVWIAGAGTALASPSLGGFDEADNVGSEAIVVQSPETDPTPHNITVSYSGGTYTLVDSAGIVVGDPDIDGLGGCNQVDSMTLSCPGGRSVDGLILLGGAGSDRLKVTSANPSVLTATYVGGGGDDTIAALPAAIKQRSTLAGGAGNDYFAGGSGPDVIRGGAGDDFESGGAGNDRLFGQAGNDVLRGRGGDDVLVGGPGRNVISGGPGHDRRESR